MSWCLPDESTNRTVALLGRVVSSFAAVPALWPLEMANGLRAAERRGRISPTDTAGRLERLRALPIELHEETYGLGWAFDRGLEIARTHGLTVYDAAYLDLAMRLNLPLASNDDDLRAAAAAVGLEVL